MILFRWVTPHYTLLTFQFAFTLCPACLHRKGVEYTRLPQFKSDGQVIKTVLDEKGIIAVFELGQDAKDKNPKKKKEKKEKKEKTK